ncbi:hypothetical protein [Sphingobacterium athyrii]|nr:hypothetical protein [Sphingobacterium athyrii]
MKDIKQMHLVIQLPGDGGIAPGGWRWPTQDRWQNNHSDYKILIQNTVL